MRKLSCLMMLIASVSGFAEARDIRFQNMVNELSRLDPSKDKDMMAAGPIVGKIDEMVSRFADRKRKNQSADEYRDLVTLVGFAAPFLSFPETAQTILDLKTDSPELAAAYKQGIAGVDECRRKQLVFLAKAGEGDQDGAEAVARSLPKASDFSYAKCVAAKSPSPKK